MGDARTVANILLHGVSGELVVMGNTYKGAMPSFQQLGDDQYQCFAAGANGAIVGNYLTTTGAGIKEDLERLAAMGFTFERG